jgi:hypothetical protein
MGRFWLWIRVGQIHFNANLLHPRLNYPAILILSTTCLLPA